MTILDDRWTKFQIQENLIQWSGSKSCHEFGPESCQGKQSFQTTKTIKLLSALKGSDDELQIVFGGPYDNVVNEWCLWVTPWNLGITSTHPIADDGQTGERADDRGGTSHQQGATWPSQEAWDAPAATWPRWWDDDGMMGGGPFKSIFSMAYVMWEEGLGWRESMIFHRISILKSWWTESDWSFPIFESKVGAEQTQAGVQIWCLERLISLGPLTVIDRSPLKMGNCHLLGLDSPRQLAIFFAERFKVFGAKHLGLPGWIW